MEKRKIAEEVSFPDMKPEKNSRESKEEKLIREVKNLVLERLDLSREMPDEEIRELIAHTVTERSLTEFIPLDSKKRVTKAVYNALRKLDFIQDLLDDEAVTEVMINGPDRIFVERSGRIELLNQKFESVEKLEDMIQQIVASCNRSVNEMTPIVDARLPDGSRVNMILPPVAINGPVVTIRKFPLETMTIEKLIEYGSLSSEAAEFLEKLVIAGYNIFVSGGTGSGKTTFLNALSNFIPIDQRVITIEDSAELQLRNIPNIVSLEVRNANVEGKNEISIRDLIKCSLRMRPDRIIVGEVRDAACIDMLQAMNIAWDKRLMLFLLF